VRLRERKLGFRCVALEHVLVLRESKGPYDIVCDPEITPHVPKVTIWS